MLQPIRTIACLIVASFFALFGWIWFQIPHAGQRPGRQLSATFDAAVGMIDLYIRDDYRGFERLVRVDPRLEGVGRDAAMTVATDRGFPLPQRVAATRLLAERSAIDERFIQRLRWANHDNEHGSFRGLDEEVDRGLGLAC